MKKFFITASYNNCKKLIKVLYEEDLEYEILENAIKKAFSLIKEPTFLTNAGLQIEKEDLIDYIMQFSSNTEFVLFIRGIPIFFSYYFVRNRVNSKLR